MGSGVDNCSDNEFFRTMLDMVPATFYFDKDAKDKLAAVNTLQEEEQSRGKKRGSLSKKAQLKRARFDPEHAPTVSRIQDLLLNSTAPDNGSSVDKNAVAEPSATIDDLHKKLQDKIAAVSAKRKGMGRLDSIEKKRLKRRESKMKLKMRRKEAKMGNMNKAPEAASPGPRPKEASPPPGKPVFNKEGKMVFSKFDFSESSSEKEKKSDGGKNYKKLLEKVKADEAHIKALKVEDVEAAHKVQEKAAWKRALDKAEGVTVRDDPEKLKKTIKKQEKRKQKSTKDWDERKQHVEQKMQERQDKRQKNIKSRKQKRVDSKIKKSKKKGHILPGF